MKGVVLEAPNRFFCQEVGRPVIGAGELLIRMECAAICGTDIRILEGKKTKDVRYPSIIGHEISGTVCEVSEGVAEFSVGDRVSVANVLPCGSCPSCLAGRENACQKRLAIGYQYDGGFAEYVRIPGIFLEKGNIFPLPDDISFTAGALIEPLACCMRGQKNANVKFLDTVLIVGAGPIGLMHMQLAKAAGAKHVIVSEPNTYRREIAEALGADTVVDPSSENLEQIIRDLTGGGVDVLILAIGIPALVNSSLKLVRKGGSMCLFAGFAGAGFCTIDANMIHYNEILLSGSTAYTRRDYKDAAELVHNHRIDLDRIATHYFSLDEFQKAYETCKAGIGLKVIIKP